MIHTLSTPEAVARLLDDEHASWTRQGATALVTYLEALEDDLGTRLEFDHIALRCEWAEYPSALDAADDYGYETDSEADALAWLEHQTQVLRVTPRAIYQGHEVAHAQGVVVRAF